MIIVAALKCRLVGSHSCEDVIIPCRRHGDGFSLIKSIKQILPAYSDVMCLEQGFIDHNGFFLNRKDAYKHAEECGQLSQYSNWYRKDVFKETTEPELYSEDLY